MLIALIGDSCTGKSSIAEHLRSSMAATVFSGKDYLRLAKDETTAAALFKEQLAAAVAGGAIGIGEITSIPTAPAIAEAYYQYDHERRTVLPLVHTPYERKV